MKPILPSFLPSFLVLIAASLGPAEALTAQQQPQTIWVDVENPNQGSGNGTKADPFHSLTSALNTVTFNSGDTIKIVGRNTSYTDDPNRPVASKEGFPIMFPDGVTLKFEPDGSPVPPHAVFRPFNPQQQGQGVGFQIDGGDSTHPTRFKGHFVSNPMPFPDVNQGLEIQDFQIGIQTFTPTPGVQGQALVQVELDGVRFQGCQKALEAKADKTNAILSGLLMRSRILASDDISGVLQPTEPLVDLQASGGSMSQLTFLLQDSVILPVVVDVQNSGVKLDATVVGTRADLTLQNVTIQGRTDLNPIPPPPFPKFERAGLEFVFDGGATGSVTMDTVSIQDAEGAGVWGGVRGALATVSGSGCEFFNNGFRTPSMTQTPAFGPNFSRSGMMLVGDEVGIWNSIQFSASLFHGNKIHGVHFEERGNPDLPGDGFLSVAFKTCEFRDNGQNPGIQAHGFFAHVKNGDINAVFRRSRFTGNDTCGLQWGFPESSQPHAHQLGVSNCVFSGNQGNHTLDPAGQDRDIDPLTVILTGVKDSIRIQLAQDTISDNPTPYAVSLWQNDLVPPPSIQLWNSGSQVGNCVFDGNGRDVGGVHLDVAFYPRPPATCTQVTDLWCSIMDTSSTVSSALGVKGLSLPEIALYTSVANPTNIVDDGTNPILLSSFEDLGLVFPMDGRLIETGVPSTVPSDPKDFRGKPRNVDHPQFPGSGKDMGAFERQADE